MSSPIAKPTTGSRSGRSTSATGSNFGASIDGMRSLPVPPAKPEKISPKSTDALVKSVFGHSRFQSSGEACAAAPTANAPIVTSVAKVVA